MNTSIAQENVTTVMLVDDHPLFRKGLNQLIELEDELQVISEHSNGKDAITAALELDPDIIILDLNMQGMDGLETVKARLAHFNPRF